MNPARDNCIILLVDAPVPESVSPGLAAAFGAERAIHIHLDLLQNAYKLVKKFPDAISILSYEKSQKHPDLTWLDADDPGFLETKGSSSDGKVAAALQLAFNTGAKKALLLNHLSPGIKPEWLRQALAAVTEKELVLGPNQNGSVYLVGLTLNNLKLLAGSPMTSVKAMEELSDKAKKAKLTVFPLPEACAVESEETLRKWLETRDAAPSLFMQEKSRVPAAAAQPSAPHQPEAAKHTRRSHKHPALQPPLPGTQEQPL
jgi:glycosyltransferase A (GT-A) superfamily protein (DUF2064 family)